MLEKLTKDLINKIIIEVNKQENREKLEKEMEEKVKSILGLKPEYYKKIIDKSLFDTMLANSNLVIGTELIW